MEAPSTTFHQMRIGDAYENFAASLRSAYTLRTYCRRLSQYAAKIRGTHNLDRIIAEDLLNPKEAEQHVKRFIGKIQDGTVSPHDIGEPVSEDLGTRIVEALRKKILQDEGK